MQTLKYWEAHLSKRSSWPGRAWGTALSTPFPGTCKAGSVLRRSVPNPLRTKSQEIKHKKEPWFHHWRKCWVFVPERESSAPSVSCVVHLCLPLDAFSPPAQIPPPPPPSAPSCLLPHSMLCIGQLEWQILTPCSLLPSTHKDVW